MRVHRIRAPAAPIGRGHERDQGEADLRGTRSGARLAVLQYRRIRTLAAVIVVGSA